IMIVIGGPLLMFRDNNFIRNKGSFEGTKAIFDRWKENKIAWDSDLNGPYSVLIIDKKKHEYTCITDLMSFIPIYCFKGTQNKCLASHIDMLAKVSNQTKYKDEVSIIDFLLHGVVTYPYTFYKDIFQLQPATVHSISKSKSNLMSNSYWIPKEFNKYKSIAEAAKQLKEELENYIEKITDETENVAQFISGGEDSRTLSSLLKNLERDAYIYLDSTNREGKIARKIASKYMANFHVSTRNKFHYLNILPSCSDLVGSGSEYRHAHTYGFHKELKSYDAVFGGLLADALLKGSHIAKKMTKRFIFLPDIKDESLLINEAFNKRLNLPKEIRKELERRRINHLKYIKRYRKKSAEEWFELWPSSMNRNIANVYAN